MLCRTRSRRRLISARPGYETAREQKVIEAGCSSGEVVPVGIRLYRRIESQKKNIQAWPHELSKAAPVHRIIDRRRAALVCAITPQRTFLRPDRRYISGSPQPPER